MPCRISLRARSGVIVGVKPSRHQHVERVALQGQFQQHGVVLRESRSRGRRPWRPPRNRSGRASRPARRGRSGLKSNLGGGVLAAADLEVRLVVDADRRVGMRQVGNRAQDRVGLGRRSRPARLAPRWSARAASRPSALRASRSAGSLALPIDLLTSLAWRFSSSTSACLALRWLSSATNRATSACEPRRWQFCRHQVGVFDDESAIEHVRSIRVGM